jgi:dimethylhistidine N-methyltransferase
VVRALKEKKAPSSYVFHDLKPSADDFRADVISGLGRRQKAIPSKYFYDERGSHLFEQICMLDEYYPTRAEIAILRHLPEQIVRHLPERAVVVEFGTGSCVKVRLLLDALINPVAYVPVDISREHLIEAAGRIARDYPSLCVTAVCADFAGAVGVPPGVPPGPRIGFFPGSTIGNFTPNEAKALLGRMATSLGSGALFLVGVDLKKDEQQLHAAYNDSQGVTAAFNLNLLQRINTEIGSDFDTAWFAHHAFYNADEGRIEMHLVARESQSVHVDDHVFSFRKGETIHTENAYKYAPDEFRQLASASGFIPVAMASDPSGLFCLHCLKVA